MNASACLSSVPHASFIFADSVSIHFATESSTQSSMAWPGVVEKPPRESKNQSTRIGVGSMRYTSQYGMN